MHSEAEGGVCGVGGLAAGVGGGGFGSISAKEAQS